MVMTNPQHRFNLRMYVLKRIGATSRDLEAIMGTVEEWQQQAPALEQSSPQMIAAKLKAQEEAGRNLRALTVAQTKRASDHEQAQVDMLKLGITTPLPEEQAAAAPQLEQAGAAAAGDAKGQPGGAQSPQDPLSSVNGSQAGGAPTAPDASPVPAAPAPNQEMP